MTESMYTDTLICLSCFLAECYLICSPCIVVYCIFLFSVGCWL